jgi:hypothetical protein
MGGEPLSAWSRTYSLTPVRKPIAEPERTYHWARARLIKRGGHWYYKVYARDGRCVFADDCRSLEKAMAGARYDVAAANRAIQAGHKLDRSWGLSREETR